LRCSAVGWVAYEIQQFFKQLFQQAFEPSRKRKGTDHFAPEEPISPKKAKSKQKSLATKAEPQWQIIEISNPDWNAMQVIDMTDPAAVIKLFYHPGSSSRQRQHEGSR